MGLEMDGTSTASCFPWAIVVVAKERAQKSLQRHTWFRKKKKKRKKKNPRIACSASKEIVR
jgi:hypothetical protein